jgi:hypothetical protein
VVARTPTPLGLPDEGPRHALALPLPILAALGGGGAILVSVMLALTLRAPVEDAVEPRPDVPSVAMGRPPTLPEPVLASAAATARPAASSQAAPAQSAEEQGESVYELRSRFTREVRLAKLADAQASLDRILAGDAAALDDAEMRGAVLDLALRVAVASDREADQLFNLVATGMGTHGPDMLFTLVTTKGGSRAAKRAEDLLRDDAVRARGTPALRIAYDLRASRCGEKPALFERAGTDGDGRALGLLMLLNQDCRHGWRRSSDCCFPREPALVAAIDAIRTRLR